MTTATIAIETSDGIADGYFLHPDDAPAPAVIIFMDGLGLRPEYIAMAERLVANGYAVLLPNMYYRFNPFEPLNLATDHDRMMAMVATITPTTANRDTKAFLNFLGEHPAVRGRKVGCVGYCMGGAPALSAAAAFPDRIAAAASFHGGRLAIDEPDSPHRRASEMQGEIYVGVSEIDPWLEPGETERLKSALEAGGTKHTVETYPGAQHGFAVPGLSVYDEAMSERHWERLLDLFGRTLKT